MKEKEIWKVIPKFNKYEISNFGNVRNKKTKKLLKKYITKHSRKHWVYLVKNKKRYLTPVANLELITFKNVYPDENKGKHVFFKDGNVLNDNLDNLSIRKYSNSYKDKASNRIKYTTSKGKELYFDNIYKLANHLNVNYVTIWCILKGQTKNSHKVPGKVEYVK